VARRRPKWVKENPLAETILRDERSLQSWFQEFFVGPDGKPLRLTKYQLEFVYPVLHRRWEGKWKFLFLASTRAGKTVATSAMALTMAAIYPNEDVIIIAPRQEQAEILYGHIRRYVESNEFLAQLVDESKPFRMDRMHLKNGSVIRALSVARPERVLGFGASTLIIDESAEIPDQVYYQHVLRLLASPRNRLPPVLVELSTPHRLNHLWEAWRSDDYYKVRVTWREAVEQGFMSREFIEGEMHRLPSEVFRVMYEAEFPELTGSLFTPRLLEPVAKAERWDKCRRGYRCFVGLDVAVGGKDCSGIAVVAVPEGDGNPNETVYQVVYTGKLCRGRASRVVMWASDVARRFNAEKIGVDYIGVGMTVAQYLEMTVPSPVYHIRATGDVRVEMYELVRRLAEEERILLPRDKNVLEQFYGYYYAETRGGRRTVKKRSGYRDDIADAIVYGVWTAYNSVRGRVLVGPPVELKLY